MNVLTRVRISRRASIHESVTLSTIWPAQPLASTTRHLRSGEAAETSTRCAGAGGEVVLAGRLQEPRVLPPEDRHVARRSALHVEGRQVHLRHGPRGARRGGEAARQPAQGLVRQRGGHRDSGSEHGRVPPQAPAALAAAHAGQRRLTRLPGARRARGSADAVRGNGPLQAEGVEARRVRRLREESGLFREGPTVPRRDPLPDRERARHADGRAAGGARGRGEPARQQPPDRRPAQGRRARHGHHAGGRGQCRESAPEHHQAAVQRCARAPGTEPRRRSPGLHQGGAAGQRHPRRRHARGRSASGVSPPPTSASPTTRRRRGSSSSPPATRRRIRCGSRW